MTSSTAPKPRSKFSVVPLIRDHYGTFKSFDSGQVALIDYLIYVGGPLLLAIFIGIFNVRAGGVPDFLAAVAILTGLIFNAVLLVSDLSVRASEVDQNSFYHQAVKRLAQELRANISYAVLLGLTLSALLGAIAMFTDTSKPLDRWLTMIIVALGTQLLLTVLLVLKRLRSLFSGFEQPEEPVP